eukprot:CAMPEP_0197703376 /NCGR_PEP_ID=MMETSP1338-20131121/125406_1 /TAXON_ID=43686 ORGANISM="Pelagodinium beii, Strain RCC1491" /NCGR_SAMPLE_ID=MMETSP1338 /ASSEMBLY_ACC=CAM_ASM_000754 /LENGTH=541 /DNA_ID=CAMNT_0043287271 /DNA_START=53 /DNA_END=1678 /DNA_ORIENTATION=-
MAGTWLALFLFAAPKLCWGHGKLTSPTPRDGISVGRAGLDENNPVSFEPGCNGPMNRCDAFVCREASPNSNVAVTQVTAGGTLQLQWSFTAFHVGDCSVYISYDVDLPRSQQKYVKIANLPDCKSYPSKAITIPAGLPSGRAILRWDWAALHIWPTVEFYVQCADIQVSSSSSASPASLDSYSITSPPVYPDNGNDGVGYRNAFNSGMVQAMTGPSCFDSSINDCSLTASGTLRNTDGLRGNTPAPPTTTISTTRQQSTSTSATSTTPAPTTTSEEEFSELDGGSDRACRGANSNDNDASYYTVIGGTPSLEACKNYCRSTAGCVGIEYKSGSSRCEVWTRPDGIGASARVPGFQCLRYTATGATTTTTMVPGEFSGVDGGSDRACRGATSNDNDASYYTVIGGTPSLEACKNYCRSTAGCVGIEYKSGSSRCEVWTRPDGIGASARVPGFQCLRYTATGATTTVPSVECVPLGACSAWCIQTEYEAFCSAQGAAGSCPTPWCMASVRPSMMATKSRKHTFLGTALFQADTEISLAMRHEL